jgi:hypothetical protein
MSISFVICPIPEATLLNIEQFSIFLLFHLAVDGTPLIAALCAKTFHGSQFSAASSSFG